MVTTTFHGHLVIGLRTTEKCIFHGRVNYCYSNSGKGSGQLLALSMSKPTVASDSFNEKGGMIKVYTRSYDKRARGHQLKTHKSNI